MPHLDEGILHELLDGEIPSTDLPPIQAHLAACPECRARLEEAREFAGAADRLIETIELTEQEPPRGGAVPLRPTPRRWGRDFAWAATVVVAVGAGYLVRGGGQPASLALKDSAAPAAVAAPKTPPATEPDRSTRSPVDQAGELEKRANAPASPLRQGGAKDAAKTAQSAALEGKVSGAAARERNLDLIDSISKKHTIREQQRLKLEELVVTGVAEASRPAAAIVVGASGVAPRAPQPLAARTGEIQLDQTGGLSAGARRDAAPVEITFLDAVARLGGSMRLIEGLVPLRLEVLEPDVRVVYPITGGELILAQRLESGKLTYRLVAPAGFPSDSLERLRARVRE